MSFYLDTNVWIARWKPDEKPDDPHHQTCKRLIQAVSQGRIRAATSVMTAAGPRPWAPSSTSWALSQATGST